MYDIDINMVRYHGNHCLNPILLGSESGCHSNVLYNTPHYLYFASALPRKNNGAIAWVKITLFE